MKLIAQYLGDWKDDMLLGYSVAFPKYEKTSIETYMTQNT